MKNKKEPLKKSTLGVILYLLVSWLPASRKKVDKLNLRVLQIFAAQRELQMITRQDMMTIAGNIMKFHGAEIMKEKGINKVEPTTQVNDIKDNTENMYG